MESDLYHFFLGILCVSCFNNYPNFKKVGDIENIFINVLFNMMHKFIDIFKMFLIKF